MTFASIKLALANANCKKHKCPLLTHHLHILPCESVNIYFNKTWLTPNLLTKNKTRQETVVTLRIQHQVHKAYSSILETQFSDLYLDFLDLCCQFCKSKV